MKISQKSHNQTFSALLHYPIAVPQPPINHKKYSKTLAKYLKKICRGVYFHKSYSLKPASLPKISFVTDRLPQFWVYYNFVSLYFKYKRDPL